MNTLIIPFALLIIMSIFKSGTLKPITRSGYKTVVSSWTTDEWCILATMALYDNLGVTFSVEDEEPWFKKMVIRKYGKTVEEFHVDIIHRTLDEFEDKVWKISKYGMPSIECPPFSSVRELEMKLELSGVKKLDR